MAIYSGFLIICIYIYMYILVGGDWNLAFMTFHFIYWEFHIPGLFQ